MFSKFNLHFFKFSPSEFREFYTVCSKLDRFDYSRFSAPSEIDISYSWLITAFETRWLKISQS